MMLRVLTSQDTFIILVGEIQTAKRTAKAGHFLEHTLCSISEDLTGFLFNGG